MIEPLDMRSDRAKTKKKINEIIKAHNDLENRFILNVHPHPLVNELTDPDLMNICQASQDGRLKEMIGTCPTCGGDRVVSLFEQGATEYKCPACNGSGVKYDARNETGGRYAKSKEDLCSCSHNPGEFIPVEDPQNPICSKCHKKILSKFWVCGNNPQGNLKPKSDGLEEVTRKWAKEFGYFLTIQEYGELHTAIRKYIKEEAPKKKDTEKPIDDGVTPNTFEEGWNTCRKELFTRLGIEEDV